MTAIDTDRAKEDAAKTQTFGFLTIDKRVLSTPTRTISIRNIATVSVGTNIVPADNSGIIMQSIIGFVCVSGALAYWFPRADPPLLLLIAILALVVAAMRYKSPDRTHYLLISTSDGVLTRFTGPRREVLDEVRSILTAKINSDDEASTFNVNFEKGIIENLNVAHAGHVNHTTTHDHSTNINGSGNTVATNGASAVSGQGNTVHNTSTAQTVNGAGGRIGTSETTYTADRSPGAQLGNGHSQQDTAHTNTEIYVDFANYLPAIVDMHRFYARQPNAEHLEQRLSELELLMRAGAPNGHQKGRVRELAGDLSQILQAYPAVVQVFQGIARLAGF